jgi:hypothetical protein
MLGCVLTWARIGALARSVMQRARHRSLRVGGDHLIRRLCRKRWRPAYMPSDMAGWHSLVRIVNLCFAVL